MEYRLLGKTGLRVSRLCFGTLTLGPLQACISPEVGGRLIRYGFDRGINFLDTAELYDTYPHIACAIRGMRERFVIASKSYAYTYEGMRQSVERVLRELNIDYIDIFALHEQESRLTLKGHEEALEYLCDAKAEGKVRAVGVSTHAVEVVEAAIYMDAIDVLHPIVNKAGLGIIDGTIDRMLDAVKRFHQAGKGVYGMKPLGGGNLINSIDSAFEFVMHQDCLDSIAVGMQSEDEIDMNVKIFSGEPVPQELRERVSRAKKVLHIEDWCTGCGSCVERCQQNALYLEDGRCTVHHDKCILCGYCSRHCPDFCIKVI